MRLTLARHGESVSNRSGRWQGQGDSPLSEQGRAQAQALAERLAETPFDRVIASDLSRAADTAEALGRPVQLDPAWRELDLGRWEGLTRQEVAMRWPDEVAALRRGEDRPVGGRESWGDLAVRTASALADLAARHPGEDVLLVAHGGVIITLLSTLFGVPQLRPRRLGKLGNTSLSTVLLGERPTLERYNDDAHCQTTEARGTPGGRGVLRFGATGVELEPDHWAQAQRGARLELQGAGASRPCADQLGLAGALSPLRSDGYGLVLADADALTLWSWNVGGA